MFQIKQTSRIAIYLLIIAFMSSCSSTTHLTLNYSERNTCRQQNASHHLTRDIPKPFHEVELDTALVNRFSMSSLNVANSIGLLDELSDYITVEKKYQKNPSVENRMTQLVLSQKISDRISIASLEVSSVASELDCEEERIAQIADYLRSLEIERESKLTVAAIGVSALGAIIPGIMLIKKGGSGSGGDIAGLVTGIIEVSLGVSILMNSRKVEINHPQNALRDIWDGSEASGTFPPFIWYYLNYHNPHDGEIKSVRYQIIDRWVGFKQISGAKANDRRKLLALYFGDGGKYSTDQLYNRANMYDQLESYIKLMKQDLTLLSLEFDFLK